MNLNIHPDPLACINIPGGVNSVIADQAAGFLAAGHTLNHGAGLSIVHAVAQSEAIDVFHCHGLYPIGPDHFDPQYSALNQIVLDNALKARLTVCISEFSANLLRHRLHIDPHVTRNGIYVRDYPKAGSRSGAVLFAKTALDANAKSADVEWLKHNSDLPLLSIANIPGVKSLGPLPRQGFLKVLQSSAIYLGTTKENNSMAIMESLISGVPLVGYNFGFAKEWLISGIGCELVTPGDRPALRDALHKVLSNWPRYSKAAREYAHIFDWQPVIDELLGLYARMQNTTPAPNVSIIIPCHNYAQWVGEAIESALAQSVPCEVIVIDDHSQDDSPAVINRYARQIKIITNAANLGVAESRNKAIRSARGALIVCLDADDRLAPEFVAQHLAQFEQLDDAIAYAPIALIDAAGKDTQTQMFKAAAIPALQKSGKNQIPSCCMFRKTFWQRAGGYEARYSPAEDAQLWLKIFALGGNARRASNEPLMHYRVHGNSLSSKGFPDWWDAWQIRFNAQIEERDPQITVILDSAEGAEQTLWSLENQEFQKWAAYLPQPNHLSQTFPWLNKAINPHGSLIRVKAGSILPPDYLSKYAAQIVPWIETPRRG